MGINLNGTYAVIYGKVCVLIPCFEHTLVYKICSVSSHVIMCIHLSFMCQITVQIQKACRLKVFLDVFLLPGKANQMLDE